MVDALYLQQIELLSGLRDLETFLIPFYIDYQATTFGHQYSFEWHSYFDDSFVQNSPLQRAYLFTDTSMLGPVSNQGFNQAQRRLAYQIFLFL